mmetsp:Transcript_1413/g.3796  ORF Transcript_1413/g.3796 Transcript_1413/m.3796 type:complete len:331 (+) Transcript_1413:37-1029(+)|eukprot:CAMPEP_0119119668 /NCGR_PEP_ID=MMETSP1310-20130426/1054_1 /TAXON_ID=464262 /ORGANISM="Genus nov. species nov., Strain RCC2339" /LENGTH=330 /DNA_ID=CAMNT_0007109113 /DNA_START=15 /DNA_END=1007 /DNA_ORIENTATION=+
MSIFWSKGGEASVAGLMCKQMVSRCDGGGKEGGARAPPKKRHAGKAILAGGISGGIEICITYPTEYTKTYMQLYPKEGRKGPIYCAKQTVANHGVKGLYRGLVSLLYFSIPKVAVRFGAFEQAKGLLMDPKTGEISPARTLVAGLSAGVMEATLVVTPTETMKVRLIHDQLSAKPKFRGFVHGVSTIVKEQGFSGTYKGFGATVIKQGSNQAIRFVVYDQMKQLFLGKNYQKEGKKLSVPQTMVSGAIAGAASVFGNTPVDVVKTKMQGLDAAKYRSIAHCCQEIFKEHGIRGFYSGTTARLGRVCADVAIVFVLYEEVTKILDKLWKTD